MTPIKTSLSSSPPSSHVEPYTPPPSPPAKKPKSITTPKTPKTPKATSSPKASSINGTWTADGRAGFMDDIIAVGYKTADLDQLADKYGMSKRQLIDQLTPNKSNFRGKAVKAVKG